MKYYASAERIGRGGSSSDPYFVGDNFCEDAEAVGVLTARAIQRSKSLGDYSVTGKIWREDGNCINVGEYKKMFNASKAGLMTVALEVIGD